MWVDRRRFDQADHHQGRYTSHRTFRGEADEQTVGTSQSPALEPNGPPLEAAIGEDGLERLGIDDLHHDQTLRRSRPLSNDPESTTGAEPPGPRSDGGHL